MKLQIEKQLLSFVENIENVVLVTTNNVMGFDGDGVVVRGDRERDQWCSNNTKQELDISILVSKE